MKMEQQLLKSHIKLVYDKKKKKLVGKLIKTQTMRVSKCGNCIMVGHANRGTYRRENYYDVVNKTRTQDRRFISEIGLRHIINIPRNHQKDFKPDDVVELEHVASNKSRWVFNHTGEQDDKR